MKYTFLIYFICFQIIALSANAITLSWPEESQRDIAFELVDGLMLVQVEVNGVSGTYIIDSGAPSLVVNQSIDSHSALFTAIGQSHIPAKETIVNSFKLGPFEGSDIVAWSMDLGFVERQLNRPIAGLVGADFLANQDVLLNYERNQITFLPLDSQLHELVSTSKVVSIPFDVHHDNLPVVTAIIDDKEQKMAFDTGAGLNVVHTSKHDPKVNLQTLSLKSLKVRDAQFISADLSKFVDDEGNRLDGILSAGALNASHIILSYSKSCIFIFYPQES